MDELLKLAGTLTPGSAAALAFVGVLAGWLIPRWTHTAIVKAKDEEIAHLRADRGELVDLAQKLMVTGQLQQTVLGALPSASDGRPSSDGHA